MDHYLEIESWNPNDLVTFYEDLTPADWWEEDGGWRGSNDCNSLIGSDGQQFKPGLSKDERIWVFQTDICRSMYAEFDVSYRLFECVHCAVVFVLSCDASNVSNHIIPAITWGNIFPNAK